MRNASKRFEVQWIGVGLLMMAFGCVARKEDSVVLYCATDREYAAPILDGFERAHASTEVARQFDIEASKTLGLVTRIEQEAKQPRCDVFWNNEILHTIRLQKKGLLAARRWRIPDDWPKRYRAVDGSWVGIAARARVLIVNKELLKEPSDWPSSVSELSDPNWKGKCGMAYPIYGTTATHMSVLATNPTGLGDGLAWGDWIQAVHGNAVILAGNKQVAIAVASGELAWGVTDTDDAIIEKERGEPVEFVFPDQAPGGFGTVFIPNTVALIAGAAHPVSGGALCDYLVSEQVESRLTMSSSAHFPVWPGAKQSSRVDISNVRWADADFEVAAADWESTRDRLLKVFQQ